MRKLPQPIPYQGSKRSIAQQILSVFPKKIDMLIEPFAGSAAVSVAAAYSRKAERFYLNDLNKPLMDLLEMIVNQPYKIADNYEKLWHAQLGSEREFYDFVRGEFNKTHRPDHFLYLLARCVKASVRYNANGEFNQSPDNRRKGRRPASMRQEILNVSNLLRGKTFVTSGDYRKVLDVASESDLVYLDPPYQGTSHSKDPRYYSGLAVDELIDFLEELNERHILFVLSYDGRTGEKRYGVALPIHLNLHRLEIHVGRSSQSTLLGGHAETYESLYLSPALTQRLNVTQNDTVNELMNRAEQHSGVYSQQLELGIV